MTIGKSLQWNNIRFKFLINLPYPTRNRLRPKTRDRAQWSCFTIRRTCLQCRATAQCRRSSRWCWRRRRREGTCDVIFCRCYELDVCWPVRPPSMCTVSRPLNAGPAATEHRQNTTDLV